MALRSLATELRGSARCATVSMHPLRVEDVRAYLIARFGQGRIESLARTLHRLTGGIPVSVVAATDGLIEADYLTFTDGLWQLRYAPRTIEAALPKKVLDMVLVALRAARARGSCRAGNRRSGRRRVSPDDVAHAAGIETPVAVGRRLEGLSERGFISEARRRSTAARRSSDSPPDARRRAERARASSSADPGRSATGEHARRSNERFG